MYIQAIYLNVRDMTPHLAAKPGDIAEMVLLPGDPLRAQFIAENYLQNVQCYNKVRNMLGFTGTLNGQRVSVQSTGMGGPSISIYANELIRFYGVQQLVRVGTCGALQEAVQLGDLILVQAACSDSALMSMRFPNHHFAATASFTLLQKAYAYTSSKQYPTRVGPVLSTDVFYADPGQEDDWKKWANYGVLALEMETAELLTLAANHQKQAASILTVTDNLVTDQHVDAASRQTNVAQAIETALALV